MATVKPTVIQISKQYKERRNNHICIQQQKTILWKHCLQLCTQVYYSHFGSLYLHRVWNSSHTCRNCISPFLIYQCLLYPCIFFFLHSHIECEFLSNKISFQEAIEKHICNLKMIFMFNVKQAAFLSDSTDVIEQHHFFFLNRATPFPIVFIKVCGSVYWNIPESLKGWSWKEPLEITWPPCSSRATQDSVKMTFKQLQ